MGEVYAYLVGVIGLGILWLFCFLHYKKLRKECMFGSILYPAIIVPLFLLSKALAQIMPMAYQYVPHYYNPDTLFNLSRITGGLAIEDALFSFFVGGIVTIIYEVAFHKRIRTKTKHHHHILSLVGFVVCYLLIARFLTINPIYNLILSGICGFVIIAIQRRDLIKHALAGALVFTLLYAVMGVLFILAFNDIIPHFWNREALSGLTLLKFPIEELLYAFSFGLMWAPMYEYVKGCSVQK